MRTQQHTKRNTPSKPFHSVVFSNSNFMNKILTLLIIVFALAANAQEGDYSYIQDKRFFEPEDVVGYDFKPSAMERSGGREEAIEADSYSFGITTNNLFVDGEGLKGTYNINNIDPTGYGFKLSLLDVSNPMVQGHLKIVLRKGNHAEALIFKKDNKSKEIIFFLPEMQGAKKKTEDAHFTNRWEQKMEEGLGNIWGKSVWPLFEETDFQRRLQIRDSMEISFVENWRVEDKRKKKKKKKAKEGEEMEEEEPEIDLSTLSKAAIEELAEENKKIKVIKEYFLKTRILIPTEDGTDMDEITSSYRIKNVKELEDEAAGGNDDRYQIILQLEKSKIKEIYIYLTTERTISAIEIDDTLYLMQGH